MEKKKMEKSEQINELAKALSKFQGIIKDVCKEKSGYGYKYADLSQILEIARPELSKQSMAITQHCGSADDSVSVETMLMHESGQWMSSVISMPIKTNSKMSKAQEIGSVITYARRYALASILGIAQTDTDASDIMIDKKISFERLKEFQNLLIKFNIPLETQNKWKEHFEVSKFEDLTQEDAEKLIEQIKERYDKSYV
jgi:hypothetical protein